MKDYSRQNKRAWEFNAYEFWVKTCGTPSERAKKATEDPIGMLKKYSQYFDTYDGIKVANICGSCGKKAIPLALLGAQVTIFDISEDNKRYALETAEAAKVEITFEVCDILEINPEKYCGNFDVVFMEGGILHYFHDIDEFMRMMASLLKEGGKLICSDFHPFTKIANILDFEQPARGYFSTDVFEGEMAHARLFSEEIRKKMPKCSYRKYTISEIINSIINSGFSLERFDEHPSWTNEKLPGEFTAIAMKKHGDAQFIAQSELAQTARNMINVKWIFFDIGSTLIDESECYRIRYREAVEGTTISPDDFERKVIEFSRQNLKGDHEAVKYYGVELPPWHKEAERPYADTESVLKQLTARGYRLGVIANQSPGTKDRLSNWGLLKYFDIVLASAEEGVSKPDLEIFRRALTAAKCPPNHTVMVGDRLDNDIVPAKNAGMKTIWIKQGLGGLARAIYQGEQADYEIENLSELLRLF